MFPAVERPRITEIQVRIDCNGCVQKIKKALHGINGIYDVCIDLPQQKLAIIGWADPEKIIKAIKKARKTATIYSHCEVQDPSPPPPPPDPSNNPPPPDQSHPPHPEPQPQHPPCGPNDPHRHHPPPRDVEEVHVIHHHSPGPPGYGQGYGPGYNPGPPLGHSQGYGPDYGPGPHGPHGQSQGYDPRPPGPGYNPGPPGHNQGYGPGHPGYNPDPHGHGQGHDPRPPGLSQGYGPGYNPGPPEYRPERPQPGQLIHNYNQHRPSAYVTQYEYAPYARMDNNYYYNNGDYQNDSNNTSGYPTAMFNEENPNACTIC